MRVVKLFFLCGAVCAEKAAKTKEDVVATDTEGTSVKPMEAVSYGCTMCCNYGSCSRAYNGMTAGQCCPDRSCCPYTYGGRSYQCASGGCAPTYGSYGGYPSPPSYYHPPSPPSYYYPPSPPQYGYYPPSPPSYYYPPPSPPSYYYPPPPPPVYYPPPPPPVYYPPPPPPVYYPPPPPPPPPPMYYPPPPPPPPPPSSGQQPSPPPPPGQPVLCNRDTGGTCRMFGCSASHGSVRCQGGKCLCDKHHCSFNGVCSLVNSCETYTPGTCRVLGCSKSRGDARCVKGKCVCAPGACSNAGVCSARCAKETGGSCHILSCKSGRDAHCKNGQCICGQYKCAYNGGCVDGLPDFMLLETNVSPKIEVPPASAPLFDATQMTEAPVNLDDAVMFLLVCIFAVALLAGGVSRQFRPQQDASDYGPLLDGAE